MSLLATCFTLISCLLILRSWRWRGRVSPKRRLTSSGLDGITTAVRTSNPEFHICFQEASSDITTDGVWPSRRGISDHYSVTYVPTEVSSSAKDGKVCAMQCGYSKVSYSSECRSSLTMHNGYSKVSSSSKCRSSLTMQSAYYKDTVE
jgi:hypothetical protein